MAAIWTAARKEHVTRQGRVYWYDTYRVGSSVKRRYIGEDGGPIRERLARHDVLKAEREGCRQHRSRLVRVLRAEGFLSVDAATGSLLNTMAQAGVFRLGGILVGTHAFRLCEGELGVRLSFDQAVQTVDIASVERVSLALSLDEVVEPPLAEVLADFNPAPGLERRTTWRGRQTRGETLVEFLCPSYTEEEGLRRLPARWPSREALDSGVGMGT